MGINIIQTGESFQIPVRNLRRKPRFQMDDYIHQIKKGAAYVASFVRWLLWTTTIIVCAVLIGSILLEFVGYYGAFNWLINTIYGASTIIMKMLGWGY